MSDGPVGPQTSFVSIRIVSCSQVELYLDEVSQVGKHFDTVSMMLITHRDGVIQTVLSKFFSCVSHSSDRAKFSFQLSNLCCSETFEYGPSKLT